MIWMHEFWLWCGFKSLKIFVKKSLKIIVKKRVCENLCKSLNLKYVWKVVKNGLWKAFKIVGEICVKIWIWKHVKDLNLKRVWNWFEMDLKKKKKNKLKLTAGPAQPRGPPPLPHFFFQPRPSSRLRPTRPASARLLSLSLPLADRWGPPVGLVFHLQLSPSPSTDRAATGLPGRFPLLPRPYPPSN
jgi:hypothetical protein